jgi:hypothetical protein
LDPATFLIDQNRRIESYGITKFSNKRRYLALITDIALEQNKPPWAGLPQEAPLGWGQA